MKQTHNSLLIALLLFVPTSVYAGDLFVQSVKAPILAAPSMGSPKIIVGVKGDMLKEVEKKDNWYKVNYKDKTGWVSRLLVGPKPPVGKVSLLEETGEKLEKGVRKRASAFTTAAAARGLAEDRARISDKFKVDFLGVETMEALNITDDEVMRFLQEGVGR